MGWKRLGEVEETGRDGGSLGKTRKDWMRVGNIELTEQE